MLYFQPWSVPVHLFPLFESFPFPQDSTLARTEGPQAVGSPPAEGWEVVEPQRLVTVAAGSGHNGSTDRDLGFVCPSHHVCLSIPWCQCVHTVVPMCPSRGAGLQPPLPSHFAEVVMSHLKQARAVPRAAAEDQGGNKAKLSRHLNLPRSHGYHLLQSNRDSITQCIPICGTPRPCCGARVSLMPPTPTIPLGHGSTDPWDVPPQVLANAPPQGALV